MPNYYNTAEQPQFSNIDGTVQGAHRSQKPTSNGKGWGKVLGTTCAVIYFLLLTAVAVIAFILGVYATDRVRAVPRSDAVLVSDPQAVPSGYSVFSLGTGLGYWSPTTDMLYARSDHGVISYETSAFLVGGMGVNNLTKEPTVLNKVVKYDTETGRMHEVAPIPQPRYRFAYAQTGGKIYVMGGTDTVDGNSTNLVFVYDIAKNVWTNMGQLTTPRIDACGAAVNGKVYVFGGYDADWKTVSTMEVCDPSTATSTSAARCMALPASSNLIDSRGDCRAVAIDGLIYAVGGNQWYNDTSCTSGCYRFLNTVEAFDPATGKWSSRAPMNFPRGDFGIEALPGGRIIVAGGERGNGARTTLAMYDVEEYIVQHDIWVQKAPLPQARFRDDLAYIQGRVYAFGGTPTCDSEANSTETCNKVALKTVFAYFDQQYPRLYAFYKSAPITSR